jgi:small subunit ribosomal protein S7
MGKKKINTLRKDMTVDPKYGSELVEKFVCNLMRDGKKRLAERLFYESLERVSEKTNKDGMEVFRKAIENVKPTLEVKTRRVGGANYQVPMEVAPKRKTTLAIRWLIQFANSRNEHSLVDKLSNEFIQAFNNEGAAIRKKVETHKMAEANKAFAHFRW